MLAGQYCRQKTRRRRIMDARPRGSRCRPIGSAGSRLCRVTGSVDPVPLLSKRATGEVFGHCSSPWERRDRPLGNTSWPGRDQKSSLSFGTDGVFPSGHGLRACRHRGWAEGLRSTGPRVLVDEPGISRRPGRTGRRNATAAHAGRGSEHICPRTRAEN